MKLKLIIGVSLVIVGAIYLIGLTGNPFIFVISIPIASLAFLLLLGSMIIWKLPPLKTRGIYKEHKILFLPVAAGCLIFLILGGWLINHYCLPHPFNYRSLTGDAGILLFTIFLGWSLIKPIKRKLICIVTAIFILFVSILTAFSSITYSNAGISSNQALESLPYLSWVSAEKNILKSGVTKYDRRRSLKGINIYTSENLCTAYLMDMSGNILHTYSNKINSDDGWIYMKIYPNGDLLSFVKDKYIVRLDWESNVKWIKRIRAHHDIAIADNKDIYTLSRKDELVYIYGIPVPILNEYILILSPEGEVRREISLSPSLKNYVTLDAIINIYLWMNNPKTIKNIIQRKIRGQFIFSAGSSFDVFHNNTIELIDRDIDHLCEKGNLLISIRELDLIGIFDIEREELIWSWGPGSLSRQHHPTLLKNGNIQIFDNGCNRKYSRIVELNPLEEEIVWEYKSDPVDQFYSYRAGSSQRLPDGNILITDYSKGRVFEITRDGEVVWEFYNPEIRKRDKKRASIYRMMRITDPENYTVFNEMIMKDL